MSTKIGDNVTAQQRNATPEIFSLDSLKAHQHGSFCFSPTHKSHPPCTQSTTHCCPNEKIVTEPALQTHRPLTFNGLLNAPPISTWLTLARWMQYALKWRDYYQQQKKKMYHQESKGIVRQVFRKWYRQGQVHMRNYNTQNVMSPQPAWDAWEEQARRLWHQSTKKILECTYRRVKDEVRQYTRKLLAGHEWAIAILPMLRRCYECQPCGAPWG